MRYTIYNKRLKMEWCCGDINPLYGLIPNSPLKYPDKWGTFDPIKYSSFKDVVCVVDQKIRDGIPAKDLEIMECDEWLPIGVTFKRIKL